MYVTEKRGDGLTLFMVTPQKYPTGSFSVPGEPLSFGLAQAGTH